jgi:hypothetical protein
VHLHIQWWTYVETKLGHGPPSLAQNTEELEEKLAQKYKNILPSLSWPAQQL